MRYAVETSSDPEVLSPTLIAEYAIELHLETVGSAVPFHVPLYTPNLRYWAIESLHAVTSVVFGSTTFPFRQTARYPGFYGVPFH